MYCKLFGFPFLPSQDYIEEHQFIAKLAAIASILFSILIFYYRRLFDESFRDRVHNFSEFKKSIVYIFGPLIVGMLGYFLIMGTVPMAQALVAGETVSLRYTVADATRWSDRKCRPKVVLKFMPMFFDEVCFVPEELREKMRPGGPIVLIGRGTKNGVFYRRIGVPDA